jgi:hypothetical protein
MQAEMIEMRRAWSQQPKSDDGFVESPANRNKKRNDNRGTPLNIGRAMNSPMAITGKDKKSGNKKGSKKGEQNRMDVDRQDYRSDKSDDQYQQFSGPTPSEASGRGSPT